MLTNIHYLSRPVTISTLSHLPAITPISPISRISAVEPADEELTSQLQQNPVINQVLIYQGLKADHDLKKGAAIKSSESVQAVSSTSEVQINSLSQSVRPSIEPVSPAPAPLPLYSKDGQTHNAATNPPQRLSIEV